MEYFVYKNFNFLSSSKTENRTKLLSSMKGKSLFFLLLFLRCRFQAPTCVDFFVCRKISNFLSPRENISKANVGRDNVADESLWDEVQSREVRNVLKIRNSQIECRRIHSSRLKYLRDPFSGDDSLLFLNNGCFLEVIHFSGCYERSRVVDDEIWRRWGGKERNFVLVHKI